ncbi:MAG TPA: polysaccharide deacetylase family protein [Polyangiaceae bacterium]|nr:polysaccharide deacetylase family protein [Polyangiaceae bacterium]
MRLCSVSIDLDEIPNYYAIHGLQAPIGRGATAVYDLALERFQEFSSSYACPLTLFAIGADMARPNNALALRRMAERGHEIGNHTLDHRYDLTRLGTGEMVRQVQAGVTVIEGATGQRPVGFRAPGYTVTDALFRVLTESGVRYDSSVFPCPAYYVAKAAAKAAIAVHGRKSRSVLDTPAVLRAPTRPYRIGKPYWRRGNGLLELPVQVTRGLRLPYIGTALTLAGADRARWLTRQVVGAPLVNLELHGIDALDTDDGLEELRPHQPDVRVPAPSKMDALGAALETLRKEGYAFVRLREAADHFNRTLTAALPAREDYSAF